MKLNIKKRAAATKGESNSIRRNGNIPAVVYAEGKLGDTVEVDGAEFAAISRKLKQGHLPTTIFTLKNEEGKDFQAIVKGIEYHPTTYRILHLDFVKLIDNAPVNVKVPLEAIGASECPGVKLGGVLRMIIRHLPVRCLPKDIPSSFTFDARDMEMSHKKKLSVIDIPDTVRPMVNLDNVVAVIAKR